MNRFERALLALTIFFIPSNLAYHFITPTSYVNGILVDYLIPKIYLTDITISILLFIWFINLYKRNKKVLNNPKKIIILIFYYSKKRPHIFLLTGLLFLLLAHSAITPAPAAGIWFWLKIVQLTMFGWWLYGALKIQKVEIGRVITLSGVAALLFQSLLAIYQFATQHSLANYWLLGETTLTTSGAIAKTSFTGALRVLPYGTAPHPNVLAGFLAVGLITLFLCTRGNTTQKIYHTMLYSITFPITLIALFLTQSVSAWIALAIAGIIIGYYHTSSRKRWIVLIALVFLCIGGILTYRFCASGISWGFTLSETERTSNVCQQQTDARIGGKTIIGPAQAIYQSSSVSRRLRLNRIALNMMTDHPLAGVGFNQFTATMPSYGDIPGTTRFLQPVHNIYLLWLAETGLLGLLFLIPIIWKLSSSSPLDIRSIRNYSLPLLMLLLIGLFDHYPLTLQTGQMLFALTTALTLSSHSNNPIQKVQTEKTTQSDT